MTTRKKSLLAILLAFCLIFAGAMPLTAGISAYAKESNTDADPGNLYYFSDRAQTDTVFYQLGYSFTEEYHWPIAYFDDNNSYYYAFEQNVRQNADEISEISNAYVIFEMCQWRKNNQVGIKYFSDVLEDIFASLQGNGCKIMFICDTDETRFELNYRNEFLRYVDIHINTDALTLFLYSACVYIDAHASGIDIEGFDGTYEVEEGAESEITIFVENSLCATNPILQIDVFEELLQFFPFKNNVSYNLHPVTTATYAIGTTYYGADYLVNWFSSLFNQDIPVSLAFIYELNGAFPDGDYGFEVFLAANFYWSLLDTISDIMNDFLYEGDLSVYDNWPGRCLVTHKPAYGDGWLLVPIPIEEWQI